MHPLLSIVIPTLNEEKDLPNLLNDLAKQIDQNFEVIIVDGKSTDRTKEKTLLYIKKFPIQFVESPKRNLSYQRNLGFKKSTGSYIFFLDADSGVRSDITAKILKSIHIEKRLLYLPYPNPQPDTIRYRIIFNICIYFVRLLDFFGRGLAFGPGMIIDRGLFKEIGGFDENAYVAEDHNIVIKSRNAGVRPKFLSYINYDYSMRRLSNENWVILIGKYLLFIFITFRKGAVYSNKIPYKMGGD